MYLHVPAAWVSYLAFSVVLVGSLVHLRRRSRDSDRFARAAAEIGVVCTAVTLVAGSVWGHAVWGVWWAWDPRLVSTALMLVVYVAYLGLRGLDGPAPVVRRRAAVLGVAGFAIVPVVHFSVVWWRSLHQTATVFGSPTQAPPLDPRMAVALALSVVAATVVALVFLVRRVDELRRATSRRRLGSGPRSAPSRAAVVRLRPPGLTWAAAIRGSARGHPGAPGHATTRSALGALGAGRCASLSAALLVVGAALQGTFVYARTPAELRSDPHAVGSTPGSREPSSPAPCRKATEPRVRPRRG